MHRVALVHGLQALAAGGGLATMLVLAAPCTYESVPTPGEEELAHAEPALVPPGAQVRADPSASPLEVDAPRVPWPPTALHLTLLATLDDPAQREDRATIRDADSGVIASYRRGDAIRDGVTVLDVDSGVVELSNAGEVEYLSISPLPFEVGPEDVFYPDFVDDLGTEMADGVPMPPGPAYVIKNPSESWGTPRTVALLRDAILAYARGGDGPKVRIGDLSRPSGGPFPPHLSHREGRDVDIGYVLRGAAADQLYFVPATEQSLDRARTWRLVEALLATGAVRYIFMDYALQKLLYLHAESEGVDSDRLAALFQYPNGSRASAGTIRHWKGHRGHFHVRFAR